MGGARATTCAVLRPTSAAVFNARMSAVVIALMSVVDGARLAAVEHSGLVGSHRGQVGALQGSDLSSGRQSGDLVGVERAATWAVVRRLDLSRGRGVDRSGVHLLDGRGGQRRDVCRFDRGSLRRVQRSSPGSSSGALI